MSNHIIHNERVARAYTCLKQYRTFGVISRSFMSKREDDLLASLRDSSSEHAALSERERNFMTVCLHANMLQRTMILTEDFGRICYALWSTLEEVTERICRQDNPETIYAALGEPQWRVLLRYVDPDSVSDLSKEQQDFLKQCQLRNIKTLNRFKEAILKFRSLHQDLHNRIKHSNSLVFGFEPFTWDNRALYLLPFMVKDLSEQEMRVVLADDDIRLYWKQLSHALIQVMHDLLDRAIETIETNGGLFAERKLYYVLGKNKQEELLELNKRFTNEQERERISANVEAPIDEAFMKEYAKKHWEPQTNTRNLLKEMDLLAFDSES